MVVRLNPTFSLGPAQTAMSAAAELAVEAGRSIGQGRAALGAGIGRAFESAGANIQAKRHRQDVLAQQQLENQRATRGDERQEWLDQFHVDQANYAMLDKSFDEARSEVDVAKESGDESAIAAALGRYQDVASNRATVASRLASGSRRAASTGHT